MPTKGKATKKAAAALPAVLAKAPLRPSTVEKKKRQQAKPHKPAKEKMRGPSTKPMKC